LAEVMLVGRFPTVEFGALAISTTTSLCAPFQSASAFSVTQSPQVIALTMFSHARGS
jgi:hypothetical protein